MMAFLLDIITFLPISFSTNIFRINYINGKHNFIEIEFIVLIAMFKFVYTQRKVISVKNKRRF
ncbi:hypothetical protein KN817_07360 [Francisella tularensis]|nr:hypothetical protein [Francisella tularensis]MCC9172511.1 hypothetical protein [Francisella tularensis]